MTERRLVDTNLILRHLVQDDQRQAKVAAKLFTASDRGEVILVVLPTVLAECVFVLESFYKFDRVGIVRVLSAFVAGPGVELEDLPVHLDALDRYRNSRSHIVDCTLAATAAAQGLSVATFDQGFKKFPDVTVNLD
jgi:predicted nucleic-acid-binding protein